jgi:hypothetical protein
MNTTPVKHLYNSPHIQRINLDNEISLILMSGNPGNPSPQSSTSMPEFFNNHPVKDVQV